VHDQQSPARQDEVQETFLQTAGYFGLGIALLGLVVCVICVVFRGMVWASEKALSWIIYGGQVAFAACGFVFLPLCILRKTRPWAGLGFFVASYVFGTELFAYSCIVAFTIWGYAGLILGLFLGGIGVVPIALLASVSAAIGHRADWGLPWDLFLNLLLCFGTRFLGFYLVKT
jgi:hypothetical protein